MYKGFKVLYLIRGLSKSGKSGFAKSLGIKIIDIDDFFIEKNGTYLYNPNKIGEANLWCYNTIREHLIEGNFNKIGVVNNFIREEEIKPYYEMAKKYNYTIFSIVIENRHSEKNEFSIEEKNMIENFTLKLI